MTLGDTTMKRNAFLMSFSGKCCGGKPDVCTEFAAEVCSKEGDLDTSLKFNWKGEEVPCSYATTLEPFEASAETCAEKITVGEGEKVTRSVALKNMSTCCKGKKSVCSSKTSAAPARVLGWAAMTASVMA